jgi:hypothetical protein
MAGEPSSSTASSTASGWTPASGSSSLASARVSAAPTLGAIASRAPSAPISNRARRVAIREV